MILPFYWLKLRCHFRNNQGTIYEKGQLLFIESWMSTYHQLLLIYKGARQEAFLFIREIEAILAGQGQIFVGNLSMNGKRFMKVMRK